MTAEFTTRDLADWPVAILAGGLATRLRPLTDKAPKALLDVAGEPFLAYQLRLLYSRGIRRVVLCVGYRGELIEERFGNRTPDGMAIDYSCDGSHLRGTGGALKRALPKLNDTFFVLYGDSYLPTDYKAVAEAFLQYSKRGMMTVFRNNNRWDASNVEFDGTHIRRYEKNNRIPTMRHIDYGLGVLSSAALRGWPENERFDLSDVYKELLSEKQLAGFEVKERFYEIGSLEGLAEFQNLLAGNSAAAENE